MSISTPAARFSVGFTEPIRAKKLGRNACPVCKVEGHLAYLEIEDRLFTAKGRWKLRECRAAGCGAVWIDPLPSGEALRDAYSEYYTHANAEKRRDTPLARLLTRMEQEFWAARYGYARSASTAAPWLGALLWLFPLRRRAAEEEIRHLAFHPGGALLDVGCGTGEWLATMKARGWNVAGLDFDPSAVALANRAGLNVSEGTLEEHRYQDAFFDAVTLNHVIEHVPDPIGTLKECHRILKPGGQLVINTPNVASLGHKVFRSAWRGLEPPRHLTIFSHASLERALKEAGFGMVQTRAVIARSVIAESLYIRRGGRKGAHTSAQLRADLWLAGVFNLLELCLTQWRKSFSDCVNAVAIKRG